MAALATGLLLTACGGSPRPSPSVVAESPSASVSLPSTEPPPVAEAAGCDLLDAAEVGEALGVPVADGVPLAASTCSWSAEAAQASVSLAVVTVPEIPDCEVARPQGARDVRGLGAEAWWEFVQAEVGVGSLVACEADTVVTLTVTGGSDEAASRATAEELTRIVLKQI